jgi:hypothetical protein
MLAFRRIPAAVLALLATLGVLLPAASAGAAEPGYELTQGWFVLGGTAKCPNSPARHLSAKHAAAFIESWYLASIIGTLTEEKPPAALPKCTFVARDRIQGSFFQFHAFYVSQGKKAWVGLPRQAVGPGAFVPVEKWYIALPRVTPAWLGKLDPLPKAPATTTTTAPDIVLNEKDSSGSSAGWIVGGIAVAVLALVAIAVVVRTRRRAPSA